MAETFLAALEAKGWLVALATHIVPLHERLARAPAELIRFMSSFSVATSGDEKAWLLSASDFHAGEMPAFGWNEFEKMSLAAAEGDASWSAEIAAFWRSHVPLFMSVAGPYEYVACCVEGENFGRYLHGAEPDFEDASVVANNLAEFQSWLIRRYE